ncbi:unnamed protein product, partial [marine sediment metagenome]
MAEVIVTTPAELVAAGVNASADPITLNAATFTLNVEDVIIDHDCTVGVHSGQTN